MPGFAADVFGRGAEGLATLSSTVGIGAVVAGFVMGNRKAKSDESLVALRTPLMMMLAILVFAATDIYAVGLAAVAVAGYSMVTSGVAMQTSIHISVPQEYRGRVLSLYGIIFRGGPAFGALVIGIFSEFFGLQAPTIAAAIFGIVVWAALWTRRDRIVTAMTSQLS